MKFLDHLRGKLDSLNRREAEFAKQQGLSLGWQVVVFFVAMLAILERCPSDFTHAQFFAEDGTVWYAAAYNGGWVHSLLVPYSGYLVLVQRMGGALSLLVQLPHAPLLMALVGAVLQYLPAAILVSRRCRRWAPLSHRLFFAAVYLAMPNAYEIHVVLTNSMWHLALAVAILAFADMPESWAGRVLDVFVSALLALSGPFAILLAPIVLVFWYFRRQRWSLTVFGVLSLGACIQLYFLHSAAPRNQLPLGASISLFIRLTSGNVFLSSLLGTFSWAGRLPLALLAVCFVLASGIVIYFVRSSNLELRLFSVFCVSVFLAGLHSPLTHSYRSTAWEALIPTAGNRYWFFAALLFLWACCWCALAAPARSMRLAGTLAVLILPAGIVNDWRYPGWPSENLDKYAQQLKDAAPREHILIPLVPPGWTMDLIKRDR